MFQDLRQFLKKRPKSERIALNMYFIGVVFILAQIVAGAFNVSDTISWILFGIAQFFLLPLVFVSTYGLFKTHREMKKLNIEIIVLETMMKVEKMRMEKQGE